MQGFVGRDDELSALDSFMSNPGILGLAVYGKRQTGKTTLLRRFAEGKRSIYFQLDRGSEAAIVESAISQIERVHPDIEHPHTITGLIGLLESICEKGPTLIIMDEYPYMSASADHADTIVQRFMDGAVRDTGSKVIVCGSMLSSMLDIVENRGNPLYSRFGMSLEVRPLPFRDTCLFHQSMDDRDLMRMYMVFGGMPGDHRAFVGNSFEDVVKNTFLARGMPFGNAARARIGSELGRTDEMVSVVRAITTGRDRLKMISEYTAIPESTCSKYLSEMEDVGIIGKRHPMSGAPARTRYIIADGLTDLWYSVFHDLEETLLPQDADSRYETVKGRIDTFFGRRFELFCMEWMTRCYNCLEIGSWWGTEVDEEGERVGADIDIVARVSEGGARYMLYCECKFRNRMAKLSDLETLERRARKLDKGCCLAIISAGGFERELTALAGEHGAMLIGMDELMERRAPPKFTVVRPSG